MERLVKISKSNYKKQNYCQNYLEIVLNNYSQNQIIFIDGEDHCNTLKFLLNRGFYFKRELYVENRYLLPIHFAIPKEKFVSNIQELEKDNFFAPCNPTDKTSYIYHAEKDYYQQYQESFYGITMKKAGWDCMRHYEILTNNCIPYFIDLESCPKQTLTNLPKELLIEGRNLANNFDETKYFNILNELFEFTKNNLTTKKLAQYVLNHV